ncbi:MAG: hypothetical protein K6A90_11040, partial [Lachnospiraceae bacterium]|nr:hypothetical protein [Lachnospiraceae bacterium]
GHALLLNSKAMETLGIDENTKDPGEHSYFARNGSGIPTGLVIEIPAMMQCKKLLAHKKAILQRSLKCSRSNMHPMATLPYLRPCLQTVKTMDCLKF